MLSNTYADCLNLGSVQKVIFLNTVMLNVVMLDVVAPCITPMLAQSI
jgi:hypothetical protein